MPLSSGLKNILSKKARTPRFLPVIQYLKILQFEGLLAELAGAAVRLMTCCFLFGSLFKPEDSSELWIDFQRAARRCLVEDIVV